MGCQCVRGWIPNFVKYKSKTQSKIGRTTHYKIKALNWLWKVYTLQHGAWALQLVFPVGPQKKNNFEGALENQNPNFWFLLVDLFLLGYQFFKGPVRLLFLGSVESMKRESGNWWYGEFLHIGSYYCWNVCTILYAFGGVWWIALQPFKIRKVSTKWQNWYPATTKSTSKKSRNLKRKSPQKMHLQVFLGIWLCKALKSGWVSR